MGVIRHASPTAPSRVNKERVQKMRSGFMWPVKGATFQTDEFSTELIVGRATKILAMKSLGLTHPTFMWRDIDDIDHMFTQDEFLQFFIDMDQFMEGSIIESWSKKAGL